MRVRREKLRFWLAVGAFAAFLVAMASWTPDQLDDWYARDWLQRHDYSLAGIVELARYNWANYNPRIGETLLFVVDGSRLVHVIVTPLFQLALPAIIFVLARGARPCATSRDLATLVVIQAIVWLAIPIAGPIYFYRPFTANYLFASTIQLGLLVPYRLALAAPAPGPARSWCVPLMMTWGVLAGMANEHTGPTAIVITIAATVWAARRGRLRAWMIAGAIGVAAGFALLALAPGQDVRYLGVAHGNHPLRVLATRGVWGNLKLVGDYIVEIAPALLAVGIAMLAALRRGAAALDARAARCIAITAGAALAIVMTSLGSPIVEDRLYFAPCAVTAIGLAIACAVPLAESRVRAYLVAASAIVVVFHAIAFVAIYRDIAARTDDRLAAIASTHGRVEVEPTPAWWRDHWQYGEDFQYAYLRELVAHRVYAMDGIELAGAPAWAQPDPPEVASIALDYEPPLAAAVALAGTPLSRRVPAQWAWVLRDLRES
jgi:hypothetical protein